MFERYTEKARQVVVLGQDEARSFKHNHFGTEHLLLGLLRVDDGLASRSLTSLGLTADGVREQISRIVGSGDEEVRTGQIPFTPRSKKVLEMSLREALSLGHNYIGTEHILLGLVRENEGAAARILSVLGVTPEQIRDAVLASLRGTRIIPTPTTRNCPTCRGTGINPVLQTNLCPKCDGERTVAA